MSSDDEHSKTEQPTQKRLTDARKKGEVARSKEFNTMAGALFAIIALHICGSNICNSHLHLSSDLFTKKILLALEKNNLLQILIEAVSSMAASMLPLLLIILVAAALFPMCIGGFNFALNYLAPQFSRLSILSGIKRMFSLQSLVELFKGILKLSLILVAFFCAVKSDLLKILKIDSMSYDKSIVLSLDIIMHTMHIVVLPLVIIAVIDVPYQIWSFHKKMKMTKQDIKDEYKNTEGNPEIKQKIKRMQSEVSKRRMMQKLPQADVVITNPNHYAVALKYDQNADMAPILIAKGVELMAEMIKKVAAANNIPIVAAPEVSRAIYYNVKLEQEIPEGLFMAVAKILAYVFELKLYKKGQSQKPTIPRKFSIPEELMHD